MSQAVIFDLDGTLIDSAPDIHAAGTTVLQRHGLEPFTLVEARSFVGHGAAVYIERCMAARGRQDDTAMHAQLLEDFLALYEDAVHLTQLYPGVVECLEALASAGLRLGLCTNKPERPTRSVLAHLGLTGHFDAMVGGDTLAVRKPDPAPLHEAVRRIGARDVIYVGDSEVDAETASSAGVPFALFTNGYRKTPVERLAHDGRFDEFGALPAMVKRLLA